MKKVRLYEEFVNEAKLSSGSSFGKLDYTIDDVNLSYGWAGSLDNHFDNEDKAISLTQQAIKDLGKTLGLTQMEALALLNSKSGRHMADLFIDGAAEDATEAAIKYLGNKAKAVKYAKEAYASQFESMINEANVTKKDFDKVVKILKKSKHPFTVMFVPKWDEIEIIVGQDAPDPIIDDINQLLSKAGLYNSKGIIMAGDSSSYSRREYEAIERINGGHRDYYR